MYPRNWLAPLLLALCVPCRPAAAACDKTLSVTVSDYGPYIHLDQKGEWAGLDIDIMKAVFEEAGCGFRYAELVAPKRMIATVASGKSDLMLASTETAERRRRHVFGPAYRFETIALAGPAGKVDAYRDIDSFQDIKQRGLRLLVPNAGWYGDDYARALPALRQAGLVVEFTYFPQALRMLAAGRAQLMMSDPAAMALAARAQGVAIETLPYVILKTPVHMMFSKASVSAHDVTELSEATLRLEKKGVLQALRAAHGLQ